MAGAKEIRSKIASVQNTQKITKAMEMVAASKMRKSQDRMAASRPYAETMRKVIGHLAHGNLEYKHPYLEDRDVKRVGYLVVSTDRGLCGGLNINLFKKTAGGNEDLDRQRRSMRPRNDRLERCVVLQLRGRQCCCPGYRYGG